MNALTSKYSIASIHCTCELYDIKYLLSQNQSPLLHSPGNSRCSVEFHKAAHIRTHITLFSDLPLLFLPCWVQEQVPVPFFFLGHVLIFFIVVGVLHVCIYLVHAIHDTRGSASAAVPSALYIYNFKLSSLADGL